MHPVNHRRRSLVVAAASWPLSVSAQRQGKTYRVGYLSGRGSFERQDEAFRNRLGELGYVDGKNVIVEWRFNKGRNELNRDLVAELLGLKVDCIVTAASA